MENIDKYFKDRIEEYSESPAPDTWDNIANHLGHDRKRKVIVFVWRVAAGIAVLISLSIFMQNSGRKKTAELAQEPSFKTDSVQVTTASASNQNQSYSAEKRIKTKKNTRETKSAEADNILVEENNVIHADRAETLENSIAISSVVKSAEVELHPAEENIYSLEPITCNSLENVSGNYIPGVMIKKDLIKNNFQTVTFDQLLAMNQETPEIRDQKNQWLLGGEFAPQYTYRNYVSEKYPSYVMDQINSKEAPIITYSGGINITMSPGRRLSVQSGIYYSRFGQEQKDLTQVPIAYNNLNDELTPVSADVVESSNVVYLNSSTGYATVKQEDLVNKSVTSNYAVYGFRPSTQINSVNTSKPVESAKLYFEYLEVPLNLKYKIIDRRIDFSLIGGLSTNLLVASGIDLNYTDNTNENLKRSTSDLSQINYAGSVGFGFEYPIIKNFLLTIEPKFKYYLNSIDKEAESNVHPYSLGVFTGINYVF